MNNLSAINLDEFLEKLLIAEEEMGVFLLQDNRYLEAWGWINHIRNELKEINDLNNERLIYSSQLLRRWWNGEQGGSILVDTNDFLKSL